MSLEPYLLSTLIWWPAEIAEVAAILKPEDFSMARHEAIYAGLQGMATEGRAVETLSLVEYLRAMGRLGEAGGEEYVIREVSDLVPPTGATAMDHAKLIRDAAIRRGLKRDAMEIIEAAQNPSIPIEEIAGMAERAAVGATSRRVERGAVRIDSLMEEVFAGLHKQSTGEITGIRTGFYDLDQHMNGMQRTDLIILGGRPGMGKTSLALDIAGNVAIDGKGAVAFFELEMGKKQILERLLFARAGVNGQLVKKGKLPHRDWPKLALVPPTIKGVNFWIDEAPGLTPLQLLSRSRRIRSQAGGLDLVVVDNIQIMRADGRFKSKREEIADVSNNLKRIAKELDVPLIAISHLSRECERRGDPEPNLSDLKETGDIEQDADIVMLLYREEVYKEVPEDRRGEAKVIYAKFRNGEPVAKIIRFTPEHASFSNWSGRQDEPPPSYKERQSGDDFMRGIQ